MPATSEPCAFRYACRAGFAAALASVILYPVSVIVPAFGPLISCTLLLPSTLGTAFISYLGNTPDFGHGPEGVGHQLEYALTLWVSLVPLCNALPWGALGWFIGRHQDQERGLVKPPSKFRTRLFYSLLTGVIALAIFHRPLVRLTSELIINHAASPAWVSFGFGNLAWLKEDALAATPTLYRAIQDPDANVRQRALWVLQNTGPAPLVNIAPVTAALEDSDILVRLAAAKLLLIKKQGIAAALVGLARTGNLIDRESTLSGRMDMILRWMQWRAPLDHLDSQERARVIEEVNQIKNVELREQFVQRLSLVPEETTH